MTWSSLLGGMPLPEFIDNYYLKQPLAVGGSGAALAGLGDWTLLEAALADPRADLLVARSGRLWDGAVTGLAHARQLHAEGYTLVVRHAERHDARLAEVAAGFAAEFGAPVNVHWYCTPAGQYGFGWHYDAEDVFIVQTQGEKEYSLRKNTVHPWPVVQYMPHDMGYEREIMPLFRCRLAAGDCLYIPPGFWHMGQSHTAAMSLAIGVLSRTALDVIDFLHPRLARSLLWRQRLPPLGTAAPQGRAQLRARLRELLAELGRDLQRHLASDELLDAFLDAHASAPLAHPAQAAPALAGPTQASPAHPGTAPAAPGQPRPNHPGPANSQPASPGRT
jgi:50S ribosomal protein L16 3-hydroxylase